jgi:hypothetical protein
MFYWISKFHSPSVIPNMTKPELLIIPLQSALPAVFFISLTDTSFFLGAQAKTFSVTFDSFSS